MKLRGILVATMRSGILENGTCKEEEHLAAAGSTEIRNYLDSSKLISG